MESIKQILATSKVEVKKVATGWVKTKRDSKGISFVELTDGTTLKGLQVVFDLSIFKNTKDLDKLQTGVSCMIEGKLRKSPAKGQSVELIADKLTIYGLVDETYPLQKKQCTLEYLRTIGHLRPRTNTIGAVERVRSQMSFAIHEFFHKEGFFYVHTPLITASDCEGAGEMFQVTTLPLNDVPKNKDGSVDYSKDFFGKKTSLTVSGQLSGETYACAVRNIYTFGPTFRAEESNTKRHLAEFWMIEPEMAFCDLKGNIEIAEKFLKYIFKSVLENCPEEMNFFSQFIEKGVKETLEHVCDSPFAVMTYTDAIRELEKNNKKFDFPVKWGSDLQTEHERYLTEVVCKSPVAVIDYPKEIKSFYMKQNDDGKTVRGMDILVPRLGEIIGGSEREVDLKKLQSRMRELGLKEEDYWWYLDLRRYGTVPHSGFGLGFERAILYATGMQNIRDVIPYPRAVKSADF